GRRSKHVLQLSSQRMAEEKSLKYQSCHLPPSSRSHRSSHVFSSKPTIRNNAFVIHHRSQRQRIINEIIRHKGLVLGRDHAHHTVVILIVNARFADLPQSLPKQRITSQYMVHVEIGFIVEKP